MKDKMPRYGIHFANNRSLAGRPTLQLDQHEIIKAGRKVDPDPVGAKRIDAAPALNPMHLLKSNA